MAPMQYSSEIRVSKAMDMKKSLIPLLFTAVIISVAFTKKAELPIGSPLPLADHKMQNVQGGSISLTEAMQENGLLVMFSCNTCPYVLRNQKRTLQTAMEAQQQKVGVVLINSNEGSRADEDSMEAMKAYAKQQGYRWPYVVDAGSKMADAFGAKRTPECFLFNKKGKLVYHGAIDDNPSNEHAVRRRLLKEAMKEIQEGKEVSITESRSIGCAIKRKA
jgi:thioredoxin-related protein